LVSAEVRHPTLWRHRHNWCAWSRSSAHRVVLPEHEMGERVAHLVTGRMLDYIEFDDGFAMVRPALLAISSAKPPSETGVRSRDRITVVGVKHPGEDFTYATENTVVRPGDMLIISGPVDAVEAFADRT
jgi:trk system potassium uptake protein TrkA